MIFYLTTLTLSENDGKRGLASFSFGTSITFDSKLRVKSYSSAANLTKLIISPSFLNFSSLDLLFVNLAIFSKSSRTPLIFSIQGLFSWHGSYLELTPSCWQLTMLPVSHLLAYFFSQLFPTFKSLTLPQLWWSISPSSNSFSRQPYSRAKCVYINIFFPLSVLCSHLDVGPWGRACAPQSAAGSRPSWPGCGPAPCRCWRSLLRCRTLAEGM